MKLLERLVNCDTPSSHARPVRLCTPPSWVVNCILKRRESFGVISTAASYEVTAASQDEAREAVRAFVEQSSPRLFIDSIQVARHSAPSGL